MDNHDKASKFALAVLHRTLQHFDGGGTVQTQAAPITIPPAQLLNGPSPSGSGSPSTATGLFGGLNDFLGTSSNFQAGGANLQAGTNVNQLNSAYGNSQNGLGMQENFANQAAAQNGFGNQASVFNQQQNIANGTGPNPAQAMLNQATGQNVSNQAALMAGQRGASANAGLIARQAAQQGAQIQQNAIGQGAALQAQQSLNATNQLGNIAQNQVNQQGQAVQGYNTAAQNQQNILQNANSAQNNAAVGMQSNLNNVNAQVSQGNQNANNNLVGGVINGASSAIGSLFGAEGGLVEADTGGGNYVAPPAPPSPSIGSMAGTPVQGPFQEKGGGSGLGSIAKIGALFLDKGGQVNPYFVQSPNMMMASPQTMSGGKSQASQILASGSLGSPNIGSMNSMGSPSGSSIGGGFESLGRSFAERRRGQTDDQAMEGYLDADAQLGVGGYDNREVQMPASNQVGGQFAYKGGTIGDRLKGGGKVPGKPKVDGAVNTLKNDTVPAMLSAGEIVLPRSVTQSKDPAGNAAKFVAAILAKKQGMKKS